MEPRVHPVPAALDRAVAEAALAPMGVRIDQPTKEQERYATEWKGGT